MYWPHTKAFYHNKSSHMLCYQWHSRFCKILYQKLGVPQPLTQQYAIWWTTTFRASESNFYNLKHPKQIINLRSRFKNKTKNPKNIQTDQTTTALLSG